MAGGRQDTTKLASLPDKPKKGHEYCWVDTCCINKTDSRELSEAIVSVFQWYHDTQKCYMYLPDV